MQVFILPLLIRIRMNNYLIVAIFIFLFQIQKNDQYISLMEREVIDENEVKKLSTDHNFHNTIDFFLMNGPNSVRLEKYRIYLRNQYKNLKEFSAKFPENRIIQSENKYVEIYLNNFIAQYRIRSSVLMTYLELEIAIKSLQKAKKKGLKEKWRKDVMISIDNALDRISKK